MITNVYVLIIHDTHADPEVSVHENFGEAFGKMQREIEECRYGEMEIYTDQRNIWNKTAQSLCGSLVIRLVPCQLKQTTDCY